MPPAWRAACVAAAGLAASCARPSLAGAAEGSAVRGDASAWGHVQRGFIFPILAQEVGFHRLLRLHGGKQPGFGNNLEEAVSVCQKLIRMESSGKARVSSATSKHRSR